MKEVHKGILQATLMVLPSDIEDIAAQKKALARQLGISADKISDFRCIRRSIDARRKPVKYRCEMEYRCDGHLLPAETLPVYHPRALQGEVIIAGFGPAGMFAALELLKLGIKPIVLERGKPVRERRRDLAILNREGVVDENSNYCFGEGGAGTYSDGKLYTRSDKRGPVEDVLRCFVAHGADSDILVNARPHIGTNKLPGIVEAMRERIIALGGEVRFETRLEELITENRALKGVKLHDGSTLPARALILATGHSAHDVFEMLHRQNIALEAKPFALGVRIEHPQHLIDRIQYHCDVRDTGLPPAYYSLVSQAGGRGVFSFCMCPGGIIAPASTSNHGLVVNGWSPSKRNGLFANSGMVAGIEAADWQKSFAKEGPLAALRYQQEVEKRAWEAGGGKLVAPAQRMMDFIHGTFSSNLPSCSYIPGIRSAKLNEVLPKEVSVALKKSLLDFGKKMRGYATNEAVLLATESRTSSPVRIPRDRESLMHPELKGLFPCGEGAGYAGGIVSAALDGMICARKAAGI